MLTDLSNSILSLFISIQLSWYLRVIVIVLLCILLIAFCLVQFHLLQSFHASLAEGPWPLDEGPWPLA